MGNIITYLESFTDSFDSVPFSPVDSLVLSELMYIHFDGFVPDSGADEPVSLQYLARSDVLAVICQYARVPESDAKLLRLAAANPRYARMKLGFYAHIMNRETETQFSAVTFFPENYDKHGAYICFRGADSTYIGWKENFNLSFAFPMPSQLSAGEYISLAAKRLSCPIRVGGHSKGGNLAVYGALSCSEEARDRITHIYSHDGPGFPEGAIDSEEFLSLSGRIHKTVPRSSVIGMLLCSPGTFDVVKSRSFSLMQHDPYMWVIEDGAFVPRQKLSVSSRFLRRSLNRWITCLTKEELSTVSDAVYSVFLALGGDNFDDLTKNWRSIIGSALWSIRNFHPEIKRALLIILFKALPPVSKRQLRKNRRRA